MQAEKNQPTRIPLLGRICRCSLFQSRYFFILVIMCTLILLTASQLDILSFRPILESLGAKSEDEHFEPIEIDYNITTTTQVQIDPTSSAYKKFMADRDVSFIGSATRRRMKTKGSAESSTSTSAPIILIWTPFFSHKPWIPKHDLENGPDDCLCYVTNNKEHLEIADAVVFHWRDLSVLDLPNYKGPHQLWVLANFEAPPHTRVLHEYIPNKFWDNIDWTVTYRTDSDVYAPYGKIVPRDESKHGKWKLDSNRKAKVNRKSKMVTWLVSNCDTPSRRMEYVQELSKHVPVDIFGKCGEMECPRDNSCMNRLEATYRFYLSFENSICEDYVTEKLFRTMQYDMVPIVLGGVKYDSILPKQSYIDAMNFTCPKMLADYLKKLSTNEEAYLRYLMWKEKYAAEIVLNNWIFDLCYKIRSQKAAGASYSKVLKSGGQISSWWFQENVCRHWELSGKCSN